MDRFEISTLRSYYGNLLTDKQNEMLKLHFDDDLSFGEIAEMFNISRQAVLASINKGKKALSNFEEKLKLVSRYSIIFDNLEKIENQIENGETNSALTTVQSVKDILEE